MERIIIITCFLLNIYVLWGQRIISGNIKYKDNEPISGANVYIKNTFEGSTSNDSGRFEIKTELTGNQTIVVSFLGFKTFEKSLSIENDNIEIIVNLAEDNTQLNEVTITASQFEASDEKKSVVMARMDVCTSSGGAFDLYSALNALPGTSSASDEGGLMVRGGEKYETKTFIDGLLVESPFTAKMPNVPIRGRFSPMLFKGIVFNTGGYSAEYGQALSSALILNSIAMPKKSETGFAVYSCALNFTTTKKWKNTAITSITDYSNLKPYYSLIKTSIDWKKEPESLSQTLVFRQKIKTSGFLKILGSYMYENSGLYYQNLDTDTDDLFTLKKHNLFTIASYTGEISKNWILIAGTSFNTENSTIGIDVNSMVDSNLANEYKLSFSNQVSDKIKIKFGGNNFNKRSNREFFSAKEDSIYKWSFNSNIYAAFAETDLNPLNRLALRFGLRYEHLSLNQKDYLAPRLSLAYQLLKSCQASFAYGIFTQTPGDEYLFFNSKLDPERAEHFIVNIQITRSSRIFRFEVYHKNYKDLVKFDSLYAIEPGAYNNQGSGYARGIDVFYKDTKTIRNGDLWLSYSLMDTRRNYMDFKYSLTPTFVSKHNLTVQYKHYIGNLDVYAGFNYTFASGRPYIDPNLTIEKQQFTKAYHNLSLNVFHFTELFDKFCMLHFQLGNVLGTKHIFGYRYSSQPDKNGLYQAFPIQSVSKRFILFGIYINLQGQPEL